MGTKTCDGDDTLAVKLVTVTGGAPTMAKLSKARHASNVAEDPELRTKTWRL
jgi:hypothetical protein